jgi:hypothetical protein
MAICPFIEGSEQVSTAAQTRQSQQFFAGKADFRPPRPGAPAQSAHAPKLMEQLHQALGSPQYSRRTEPSPMHESLTFMLHQLFPSPVTISSNSPEPFAVRWGGKTRPSPAGMEVCPETAQICPISVFLAGFYWNTE